MKVAREARVIHLQYFKARISESEHEIPLKPITNEIR